MGNIKVKTVTIIPASAHELMISAACSYYDMTKSELIARARNRELARRKGILFFLLKLDGQLSSSGVAGLCETTRQNVDQAVDRTEGEVNIYLQSACDCRNIRAIYASLQKEQTEWLNRDSQQNNTRR